MKRIVLCMLAKNELASTINNKPRTGAGMASIISFRAASFMPPDRNYP